jgi:endoglucanase
MFSRDEATDRILRLILEQPTAPFHESAVLSAFDSFAAERRPTIEARHDRAGNRIWRIADPMSLKRTPTIAFTAHVDHPALVRGADGRFELLGRVWPSARLANAKIQFFARGGRATGKGIVRRVVEEQTHIYTECDVESGKAGEFAMFDFPALATDGDKIEGRVCDDLLGAISILLAIEECIAEERQYCFAAAFTRAEEVGFVGALAMLEEDTIPRDVPIVGIECSAARGGNATIGAGPIVRVGDRIATFDPGVTAFLRDCAESLRKDDPSFEYQRKLMQGGACESTAYLVDGRRAGALCLALGNYHNIPDPDAEDASTGVAPEHVSRRDLQGLARLIVRAVSKSRESKDLLADPWAASRASFAKRLGELRDRL